MSGVRVPSSPPRRHDQSRSDSRRGDERPGAADRPRGVGAATTSRCGTRSCRGAETIDGGGGRYSSGPASNNRTRSSEPVRGHEHESGRLRRVPGVQWLQPASSCSALRWPHAEHDADAADRSSRPHTQAYTSSSRDVAAVVCHHGVAERYHGRRLIAIGRILPSAGWRTLMGTGRFFPVFSALAGRVSPMFAILTLVALLLGGAVTLTDVLPGEPSNATTVSTSTDSTAAPRAVDDVIQGGPS
jgi:hypothetical protein